MAEPDKRPVTMEELLVSSLAQTDALAKLLIEKGPDYPRRVHAENFRGTGDVLEAAQSYAAVKVLKPCPEIATAFKHDRFYRS